MRKIFKYALFLIICCFLTLFALGLFPAEVNARSAAEELVSIDNELARFDDNLSVMHNVRLHYEKCMDAEYVIRIPPDEPLEKMLFFGAFSSEEMNELAASLAFDSGRYYYPSSIPSHHSFKIEYLNMVTIFTKESTSNRQEVRRKLSNLTEKIKKAQNEVFQLRERKKSILSGQLEPIPLTLNECETETATICGTWTLKDGAYHALWNNGAKAVINIVRFDDENVIFTRHDKTGSSKGLRADYIGKRVADLKAEGTVKWTWNNNKWSGTWYATW